MKLMLISFLSVVSGGGLVSGGGVGLVGGSGVVGLGLILGVDRGAVVLDISDVAVVVVSGVGDSLDTAVGEVDLVRARNGLAVSGLLGVEVSAGVVVVDAVLVAVGLGALIVVSGGMRGVVGGRGRGVVGSRAVGDGDGHEGGNNGETEHFELGCFVVSVQEGTDVVFKISARFYSKIMRDELCSFLLHPIHIRASLAASPFVSPTSSTTSGRATLAAVTTATTTLLTDRRTS